MKLKLTRRRFLAGSILGCIGIYIDMRWIEPGWLRVARVDVTLPSGRLARPFRILHVSDMHASGHIPMAFIRKAIELGIDKESIFVLDAQDDVTKQVHQMEDLINREVDAIILNPVDSDAVGSVVMDANRANIPVVTLTRPSHGGEVVQHVDTDNVSGARMAGEMVAKAMNYEGKLIELTGIPGAPSSITPSLSLSIPSF